MAAASAGASQTFLERKEAPGLQGRPDPVGPAGTAEGALGADTSAVCPASDTAVEDGCGLGWGWGVTRANVRSILTTGKET